MPTKDKVSQVGCHPKKKKKKKVSRRPCVKLIVPCTRNCKKFDYLKTHLFQQYFIDNIIRKLITFENIPTNFFSFLEVIV